ncbi:hypothetical protein [Rahnella aceris]
MATLLIEYHTQPRVKLRINTKKQAELAQKVVTHVLSRYDKGEGWRLDKAGKSFCNRCQLAVEPFNAWLGQFDDDISVRTYLAACNASCGIASVNDETITTVSLPISWICVIVDPVGRELKSAWITRLETELNCETHSHELPSPAGEYYLLCESRTLIAERWQQYFSECQKRNIPFITLVHYTPKFKGGIPRYDMLFSWKSLAHRYDFIFDSREFPNVDEVIKNRVKFLLKELKKSGAFKLVKTEGSMVNGQMNILKLGFEEAEILTQELVVMMRKFISDMHIKVEEKSKSE